jgi:hypothetical protein
VVTRGWFERAQDWVDRVVLGPVGLPVLFVSLWLAVYFEIL